MSQLSGLFSQADQVTVSCSHKYSYESRLPITQWVLNFVWIFSILNLRWNKHLVEQHTPHMGASNILSSSITWSAWILSAILIPLTEPRCVFRVRGRFHRILFDRLCCCDRMTRILFHSPSVSARLHRHAELRRLGLIRVVGQNTRTFTINISSSENDIITAFNIIKTKKWTRVKWPFEKLEADWERWGIYSSWSG